MIDDLAAIILNAIEGPGFGWFAIGVTAVITFLACLSYAA